MSTARRWLLLAAVVTTGALVAPAAAGPAASTGRPRGDIRVFARVPAPGEPSYSLVTPSRTVYVGTFESVSGTDTSPSKVFRYDASGRLRRTYRVTGQTPGAAHGVQVAQRDRSGRLYLLDQNPARVVVLDPRTGHQRTWARFADLPPCSAAGQHRCSNTSADNPPEPDYAAWLPDGSLLVTDYAQELVWRVPAHRHGVRSARVWLNDKRLDGEDFGPGGIVMQRRHHSLLMTAATGGVTSVDPADSSTQGRLYRVVLGRHLRARRLVQLWSSRPGEAPDGFAVSRHHHHVYIAMAGPTGNSLVEVAPDRHGTWRRVWQVPRSPDGAGSSPVPWDTATSAQFLGRRLLVTNQAYFSDDSSHWVVFDVEVHERGMTPYVPRRAGRS